MALSTKPYKGARDFYPEDKRLQNYMFSKWREVCERYGYEEYDAPVLEPLDIYLAKSGEEIVNEQTYSFEDRGGRQVVIRPEMTPTVSRMVAAKRQDLAYPLRWYSIPNLWRYERPQRGRLREHWQLNVDIFGISETSAETEVIMLVDTVFKSFGATPVMYEIHLNHRQLINYLLSDYLALDTIAQQKVAKLIDRYVKLGNTEFIAQLDVIIDDKQRANGTAEKILSVLEAKSLSDLPEAAQQQASAQQLKQLMDKLKANGVEAIFDGSLMRGFDYYTGIVFEVFDKNPDNNRSMLGGGRYDGLVSLFGVEPLPTVGFGWGDVTLANFLEGHELMPRQGSNTDIYVVSIGETDAQPIANQLRENGINVAVDISGRKLSSQIKAADKKAVSYCLIIGEDEIKSGILTLHNMITGKESKLTLDMIIKQLESKNASD